MSSSRKAWTYWTQSLIVAIASGAIALALYSHDPNDPSFSTFQERWSAPQNLLGYLGSWTADLLLQGLGWSSWIIPLFGVAFILLSYKSQKNYAPLSWKSLLSIAGLIVSTCLLTRLLSGAKLGSEPFLREGLLGSGLYFLLRPVLGKVGLFLGAIMLLWISALIHFERFLAMVLDLGKRLLTWGFNSLQKLWEWQKPAFFLPLFRKRKTKINLVEKVSPRAVEPSQAALEPLIRPVVELRSMPTTGKESSAKPRVQGHGAWKLPSSQLLTPAKALVSRMSRLDLVETSKKIVSTLRSFEIEGDVTEITPGPILTIYEFQPAPGTRIQKLHSVSTDLAMALGASAIRIVAPIPGKSVAGIEVPNPDREEVVLRDLLEVSFQNSNMKLPLCLGKDTEGRPIIEDLSRMPHLLIGGATSMGKSVLVNSILTGLLCRFSPRDLRLIIVDPKLVEFKIYEDIPHLLLPIVNDPMDASKALKWAVAETKRRYLKMQELAAKNLADFNEKVTKMGEGESFPYIAIIIDELAELMLTSRKDVEQSIVRLTQLARAAGIHLIMATQRPSADVVTGLIKSNCPSRAALRVASSGDSRIILDATGAELLLGKGDMFYTSSGPMGLRRLQGSYVSDADVERISNFWKEQGSPEYKNEILADEENTSEGAVSGRDELYHEVIAYAKEKGVISTSLIQRRFQIGYTRAARIMEQLEAAGVVGEQTSAGKPRDVLL